MTGSVVAVSQSREHLFSKENRESIQLIAGEGVEGDAHSGTTVKHRSRVAQDPARPNLRQVHLIHSELFDELRLSGFDVLPGQMGENITTRGLDLLGLPKGSLLFLGKDTIVEVTGLRNPCSQIDNFCPGLLAAVLDRDDEGKLVRKAGIMGIVIAGARSARATPSELSCLPNRTKGLTEFRLGSGLLQGASPRLPLLPAGRLRRPWFILVRSLFG